jgi:hypothetical protein
MLKPELMFSKDGAWKEFGLGRDKQTHTWMPFWLFAIMWAIIAYIIILVVASYTGLGGVTNNTAATISVKENDSKQLEIPEEVIEPEHVSIKSMAPVSFNNGTKNGTKNDTKNTKKSIAENMKKGYYILDTNETMKKGMPKYIYLGPEAPNLVYHNMTELDDQSE